MKRLFLTMSSIAIIIGVVGVGLQFMFGYDTITYISRVRIAETETWIYQYDFWGYIENIKQSMTPPTLVLNSIPRNWNADLLNNLAYIVDVLIFIGNILTFPIKVGAMVIRTLLSVVGINTITMAENNPLYWLVDLVNKIVGISLGYV